MPIIRKANLKCPNKKCNSLIYREWNIGVVPKLLSIGSLYFKCRKCSSVLFVSIPLYMISSFLEAMESDDSLIYTDGEWMQKIDKITDEEEKIFIDMLKNNSSELLKSLASITSIDFRNYDKEEQ